MISLQAAGIDTYKDLGLVMTVEEMKPPEVKEYKVDVPGGNGCINLTSALSGDTAYNNRSMVFVFTMLNVSDDFEAAKTKISNLFHGRELDFKLSFDEEYTYHGWFSVSSYKREGHKKQITVNVDADPFKYKKQQVIRVDAIGGQIVHCESGRKRIRPSIETEGYLRVISDGKVINLPQGTWSINDLLFEEGNNDVYLCSYDIRNLTWGDLKTNNVTWGDFRKKRLFEWYKSNGDGTYAMKTWADVADLTWADVADLTWADMQYMSEDITGIEDCFIAYEWGDL